MLPRQFILIVCSAAAGIGLLCAAVGHAAAPGTPKKIALLIGCTNYSQHESWKLEGPANDVQLLAQVLTDHFDFPSSQITTLVDGMDAAHVPTKANIQREFDRLAQIAHHDDQIVILLSGHGSQQPEKDEVDPNDHKLDGMDEVFLPSDTGVWDEKQQTVTNVVLDHELRGWIDRIANTGAHVWVIVDTCHSGTMLRGDETARRVLPEAMQIPREAIGQAKSNAKKKAMASTTEPTIGVAGNKSKVDSSDSSAVRLKNRVGLYAAQADELTIELPLPPELESSSTHGLLTYTLCQLLTPKADGVRPAITYRELAEKIRQQYAADDRLSPTPLVEGGDLDSEVLGVKQWPGRSRIVLSKTRDGTLQINAGALLGLSAGSILGVYGQDGNAEKPLAYVEIKQTGMATSVVEPCEFNGMPKIEKLPAGSRCELAFVNFNARPLKLAVVDNPAGASGKNSATLSQLRHTAEKIAHRAGSLILTVDDPQSADWLLQLSGKQSEQCMLIAKSAIAPHDGEKEGTKPAGQQFGPFDCDSPRLLSQLEDRLNRIAKAQSLVHLANQPAGELAESASAVNIKLDLIRFRDLGDQTGEPLHPPAGIELHAGDRIAFRLTNTSQRADVYPTLLYLNSQFEMTPLFPREGELVEALAPKKSLQTRPLHVNAKTIGQEQLVAIAVKATGAPVDFSGICEPTLVQARGDANRAAAFESPLGGLLEQALFHSGTTRGMDREQIEESTVSHLVWRVSAADPK